MLAAAQLRAGIWLGMPGARRGALGSQEELRAPGTPCGRRRYCRRSGRRAARRAARAGLRRGAGSPLRLPPSEGRCCRGSCAAGGEGPADGGRARPTSRPPAQGQGQGSRPLSGKLEGGGAEGRQRPLGASQVGRAPGWKESCKPGQGKGKQGARQERVRRGGKGPGA